MCRRLDDDRVGLPDVEYRDAQIARRRSRRPKTSDVAASASVSASVAAAATNQRNGGEQARLRRTRCTRAARASSRSSSPAATPSVARRRAIQAMIQPLRFAQACASGAHHASEQLRCAQEHRERHARHDGEIGEQCVARPLQEDRRGERPGSELRRGREHERFADALGQSYARVAAASSSAFASAKIAPTQANESQKDGVATLPGIAAITTAAAIASVFHEKRAAACARAQARRSPSSRRAAPAVRAR